MRLYNGDVPGALSTSLLMEAVCYLVYRQVKKSPRDDVHSSKGWMLSKRLSRARERRKENYTLQNE